MWNTIGSWFAKSDPTVLIPTVLTLGGWLWHKIRGEKTQTLSQIVKTVFDNFAHEMLDKASVQDDVTEYLKKARKYMEERMWTVLKKRGVPKNRVTEKLAHEAIEKSTVWLAGKIRELKIGK